jgi:hypothetical protein
MFTNGSNIIWMGKVIFQTDEFIDITCQLERRIHNPLSGEQFFAKHV